MSDTELGLPLEYQQMPQYFDAHNICDDSAEKNSVMEAILKRHDIKNVLDLTCGTGSQVFYLNQRGYQVTGADFSPALVEIARQKAKSASLELEFIHADMRNLQAGTFDAAITMFNAVGHLSKADFEIAMKNINRNLKPGGLYLFDIYNLAAMNDAAVQDLAMESRKSAPGALIHHIQHSTLESTTGLLTSHDQYSIDEGQAETRKLNHSFTLQIYTADEVRHMLGKSGFAVEAVYAMDGSLFDADATTAMLTVAKKLS